MLGFLLVGLIAFTPNSSLKIEFVDTEGGGATLIITPTGESILIDCGNPGNRDAERIAKAAKKLGLERIDHLVVTHWHLDHYGGAGTLTRKIPVVKFWDRGIPESLPDDLTNFPVLIAAYKEVSRGKRTTLKAGDVLPLKQKEGSPPVKLSCVCASGVVRKDIKAPLGASETPSLREPDPSDNALSLGFVLEYGDFRFLDLGDLTWNKESLLVYPKDLLGRIDVYQSTHHGLEVSNHPDLMKQVSPTIAVFNNGPRKGAHPRVIRDLRRMENFEEIFQLHKNLTAPDSDNAPSTHVANPSEACEALGINIEVDAAAKKYIVKVGDQPKEHRFSVNKK